MFEIKMADLTLPPFFNTSFYCFNSLHPNISTYILHNVLFTFVKALTRRICLSIKSVSS